MTISPKTDLAIRGEMSFPSSTTGMDYRTAVEEFDRLWETGETEEKQRRMVELLRRIDAFENADAASQNQDLILNEGI